VKNTALDALRAGFRVCVDEQGIRGVDVHPGDCERAIAEMRQAGAVVRQKPAPGNGSGPDGAGACSGVWSLHTCETPGGTEMFK
jgi:hypothetical protein